MKPEEQRIAIAEACGWKDIRSEEIEFADIGGGGRYMAPVGSHPTIGREEIPDYLNSLDAMHGAEKVLTDNQTCRYSTLLLGLPSSRGGNAAIFWMNIHATAAQRAEAFLRAVGKWRDEA